MHDFLKSQGIFVGVPNLLGTSAMSFSCFCLCVLDVVKIIATSHELIPKHGGLVREIPLLQGSLG